MEQQTLHWAGGGPQTPGDSPDLPSPPSPGAGDRECPSPRHHRPSQSIWARPGLQCWGETDRLADRQMVESPDPSVRAALPGSVCDTRLGEAHSASALTVPRARPGFAAGDPLSSPMWKPSNALEQEGRGAAPRDHHPSRHHPPKPHFPIAAPPLSI